MYYGTNNNGYFYPTQQPNYIQTPQIIPQPAGLKGRPVSSIEEVRAAQIDFDGSLFIFPDLANKKIYTKQINLDGTATLNEFQLQEAAMPPQPAYVTKEELEQTIKELKESLKAEKKDQVAIKQVPTF